MHFNGPLILLYFIEMLPRTVSFACDVQVYAPSQSLSPKTTDTLEVCMFDSDTHRYVYHTRIQQAHYRFQLSNF